MQTLVREQGTECHTTESGEDKIQAFRRIVDRKSYAKIDGVTVDLFSASAAVAVFDGLNEVNRAKFVGLNVRQMAIMALRLLK